MPYKSAKLGEVVRFVGGGTPSKRESSFWNGNIPWVSPKDMKSFYIREITDSITEAGLRDSACNLIPKGSVLTVVRSGVLIHTLPVALTTAPCALNQDMKAMIPSTELFSSFLAYWLLSKEESILTTCVKKGATVQSIVMENFRNLEIPLPPLPEQQRIVEVFEQADALRQQRRQADGLSQRILPALFHEMFGTATWPLKPLSQILRSIQGGWSPVCENRPPAENEWGVLKLGAATYCEFRSSETKALRSDTEPRKELEIRAGDLLFTRKNTRDLVGATAYVFETPPLLMAPDLIFRLVPNLNEVDPIYLWQAMIEPKVRMMIQAQASGAAASMVNISQSRLLPLELPVPPLPLQKKFSEAVQAYREASLSQGSSAATLETLFQTLLHRAFDGSLTAKWREGNAKEVLQEMKHLAR